MPTEIPYYRVSFSWPSNVAHCTIGIRRCTGGINEDFKSIAEIDLTHNHEDRILSEMMAAINKARIECATKNQRIAIANKILKEQMPDEIEVDITEVT